MKQGGDGMGQRGSVKAGCEALSLRSSRVGSTRAVPPRGPRRRDVPSPRISCEASSWILNERKSRGRRDQGGQLGR
jgi:hypothetical protein